MGRVDILEDRKEAYKRLLLKHYEYIDRSASLRSMQRFVDIASCLVGIGCLQEAKQVYKKIKLRMDSGDISTNDQISKKVLQSNIEAIKAEIERTDEKENSLSLPAKRKRTRSELVHTEEFIRLL